MPVPEEHAASLVVVVQDPRADVIRARLAGAGIMAGGARALAQRSDYVPAVVIGSGFGGSAAALRLGQAGIDTVVLERGRRWPIREDGNTFATFENPDGRAYWLRDQTGEAAQ